MERKNMMEQDDFTFLCLNLVSGAEKMLHLENTLNETEFDEYIQKAKEQ